MAQPQVRIGLMVKVNEPEPDIIDVLLPSLQKREKDVLTADNCSSKQHLSDKEKKKEEKKHQQKTGKNEYWI
jgi:hypothetical protein